MSLLFLYALEDLASDLLILNEARPPSSAGTEGTLFDDHQVWGLFQTNKSDSDIPKWAYDDAAVLKLLMYLYPDNGNPDDWENVIWQAVLSWAVINVLWRGEGYSKAPSGLRQREVYRTAPFAFNRGSRNNSNLQKRRLVFDGRRS
jgi:hypothetical protein